MNDGKICISLSAPTVGEFAEKIAAAAPLADVVEIRFDHLSYPDAILLLNELPATRTQYLFTFRPRYQGGVRDITLTERVKFWENALPKINKLNAMIDVEFEPGIMAVTQSHRLDRIVSAHFFKTPPTDLENSFAAASTIADGTIKIAADVNDASEAIPVWKLLDRARKLNRRIIPIAMGEAGKWTRILGPAHGAYMTYAALLAGSETAQGQISVAELLDVYRVKELDQETKVYGIIAGDTSYSMSPYIHNAAFKTAGLNSVFVPIQIADLGAFIQRMVKPESREVELNFRGFSVSNPYKSSIIKYLDDVDEAAAKIGAVNTLRIEEGKLIGYNTDAEGFIEPLQKRFGDLADAKIAVVGAGGAARACVYVLAREGADVTILARSFESARELAGEFGTSFTQLPIGSSHFPDSLFSDFDIVINATPIGTRGDQIGETVATEEQLSGVKLVYDLVYNPPQTRLLDEAHRAGAETLNGFDMLIAQAARQFEIWTGMKAPEREMAAAARKKLNES